MSMQYCDKCGKIIDTDVNAEHFIDGCEDNTNDEPAKARYYLTPLKWLDWHHLFNVGIKEAQLKEEERMGVNRCHDGEPHRWLVLPGWNLAVKEGGKQYVYCLRCGEHSHL